MKQDIRFKGLTLNRDEQAADHGELALCGNVELHDGALRPSILKGTTLAGGTELPGKLLYVHVTSDGTTNFIVMVSGGTGNLLKWYRDKNDSVNPGWYSGDIITPAILGTSTANITYNSISSVGNTLCLMTSLGLWYVLYKDGTYTVLGQQPPFAEIQFNMHDQTDYNSGTSKNYEDCEISLGDMGVGLLSDLNAGGAHSTDISIPVTASETYHRPVMEMVRSSVTEQVMAEVNRRIHDSEEKGQFYAPFMVRYCYRLYDGSMIMHSAPVLMCPTLERSIVVSVRELFKYDSNHSQYYMLNYQGTFNIRVFMLAAKLQAKWVNYSSAFNTELLKWSDIIKSVDIFITPQFSRIDSSKMIEFVDIFNGSATYHSLMDGLDDGRFKTRYLETAQDTTHHDIPYKNDRTFTLPEYDKDDFLTRVRTASEFFRVATYKIEDLYAELGSGSFTDVDLTKSPLYNISTHEQMTDDYKTHNLLWPGSKGGSLYTYNHRLNVYNIKEILFIGFSPKILFQYVATTSPNATKYTSVTKISVYIKTGGELKKRSYTLPSGTYAPVLVWQLDYFFYPDSRAVYMTVEFSATLDNGTCGYDVGAWLYALSSHPSLNGAIFDKSMKKYANLDLLANTLIPMSDSGVSSLRGKIYTSRTDNPFYFPNLPGESCINTVGTGDIIGIAAVTRALSQGQVGDHDLVVFATDGIWVMKVSSTGTYSALHNISREVCDNPDSICQLDQSIIFATRRSLSRFRESDVDSISDALDGPVFSCYDTLRAFYNQFEAGGVIRTLLDFGTPALDMFRTGKVLYDFASSRLLVFGQGSTYGNVALAFSLRDMTWSTLFTDYVVAAVPGYPSPYVHKNVQVYNESTHQYDTVKRLIRLDVPYEYDSGVATDGVVITRTLSFSDTMDVIRGFRQYCECGNMPTLHFFGSNDQLSWRYIGYSARAFHNYMPGHPFRFFRVAMVLSMTMKEKYQSLALEIINKYAKL